MGDVAFLLIATDSAYSRILSASACKCVFFCWSRLTWESMESDSPRLEPLVDVRGGAG